MASCAVAPCAHDQPALHRPCFAALTIACITHQPNQPRLQAVSPTRKAVPQSAPEQAASVSLTVVGLPWPGSGLPILGMDLVRCAAACRWWRSILLRPITISSRALRVASALAKPGRRGRGAASPSRLYAGERSRRWRLCAARPGSGRWSLTPSSVSSTKPPSSRVQPCLSPDLYAATQRDEATIARWPSRRAAEPPRAQRACADLRRALCRALSARLPVFAPTPLTRSGSQMNVQL